MTTIGNYQMHSVMLVDDHPEILAYLSALVESTETARVVATATCGTEALEKAALHRPDIIILDVTLEGMSGFEIARILNQGLADTRILAVSTDASYRYVEGMLNAGATGYLLKKDAYDEAKHAIRVLMNGGMWLSKGVMEGEFGWRLDVAV